MSAAFASWTPNPKLQPGSIIRTLSVVMPVTHHQWGDCCGLFWIAGPLVLDSLPPCVSVFRAGYRIMKSCNPYVTCVRRCGKHCTDCRVDHRAESNTTGPATQVEVANLRSAQRAPSCVAYLQPSSSASPQHHDNHVCADVQGSLPPGAQHTIQLAAAQTCREPARDLGGGGGLRWHGLRGRFDRSYPR